MKFNQINEAIETSGIEFAAYCFTVAEVYAKAPDYDPSVAYLWAKLGEHDETMFKRILSGVDITFVDEDPYPNMKAMMFDIIKNKKLRIFKTTDGSHPGLSPEQNDFFRAVHDYLGHFLPNRKDFEKLIKSKNITSFDHPDLENYKFKSHNFTVRGEINTYLSHAKLLPKELKAVLFTEIVGQICTYFTTGNYTSNKVAILPGIDFDHIGEFTDSSLTARKEHFIKELKDPNVNIIKTTVGDVEKDKIRWGMISRGTGKTVGKK